MSTELTDAILAMDEDGALKIVKDRLDAGEAPEAVLDDARSAMTTLGDQFACEEVFIPELIMGGEIMKGIAAELKPRINAGDTAEKRGTVVIGTVHGDIHDIGKDVVVMMLEVSGCADRCGRCRSTRCRRRTRGIPACLWARRRWPTCSSAATCASMPATPRWPDRDRFVLSAGHGSALLYALLHLAGFGLTLDDLRAFRQWGSCTPGHPENHCTPGVEVTTGPLGQGFAQRGGHGHRRGPPGGALQPSRAHDRRPPHLRARQRRRPDGGTQPRGRVAGRSPRSWAS